jgi:hypothetical protein
MIAEKFAASLQEDLITLLVHNSEQGRVVAKVVDSQFFEGDYRVIAERALTFWEQQNTAPKQHIADLLSDILEDKKRPQIAYLPAHPCPHGRGQRSN